jgi:hypothetical protein
MTKPRQLGFDEISEEWKGMPEYVQEKQQPFRTMKINFRNEEDFKAFCKLVGLDTDLKESVKSAWFPKLERGEHSNLRWVDANEGETETINYEADTILE